MKKIKIFIILSLIFILIIFFLKIFFSKEFSQIPQIDDFTFFKIFSKGTANQEIIQNSNQYEFKVKYNNIDFKSIDLLGTVDKEKLVYEKIAPGTSGNFNIVLDTNKNLKYKIVFESMNEKPQNLNFIASINEKILGEATNLDELSKYLKGNITKNEKVNIEINWYWNYEDKENSELTDIQDTEDAKKIEKYQFNIYAYGEQIS